MKIKHIIPAFLILACSTFFSCNAVKNLADVNFDTIVAVPFVINETTVNPGGKTYTDTESLNLNTDADVAKYASNIKGLTVNKVTYTIFGANPATVLFTNGTLNIVTSGTTIATASSISLSNTSETELTANAAGLTELVSKLLAGSEQQQIQLQGTLSATPVAFTMEVKFYVTVKANPL